MKNNITVTMALHKKFPKDKFQILDPAIRWFPAEEDLRKEGFEKLLPPFVPEFEKKLLNGARMIMKAQARPRKPF
jgi:hypothetical protein